MSEARKGAVSIFFHGTQRTSLICSNPRKEKA